MADKRISQLVDRGTVANNDVVPIVVSGATTTNKATISSIQTFMQSNLDVGVTSVGITIGSTGTDVNVTGSPVTSSGNITINIPTASATNRGLLSSANWTTFNNKVSSVGLSMPSAFAVANSPITGSGTIAVTGAGTVAQYIRGDGSLADFPSGGGGGGASVNYYLNGSVSQGTIGGVVYREMNKVPILGAGTDITIAADGYIASFITDAGDPALLEIPAGNWNFESYFSASSGGGSPSFYIELYKVNSGGTATLIASNSATPELISFGTSISPYFSPLAVPTTVLTVTDRLAVRYYVTHSGRTITLHTENGHLCQIITTFTTGLTALNGLTAQVQNFATGTSGTNFGISSTGSTHTFNIPTASATNRGLLSTTDWSSFNGKVPYTGAVASVDLGVYSITANAINSAGSGSTAGQINLRSDAFFSLVNGYGSIASGTTNQFNLYQTTGAGVFRGAILSLNSITASATRTFTFPDASGTLALTSDLSAYLPLTGGTISGTLNVGSGSLRIAAEGASNITILRNFTGTAQGQSGFNHVGFNNSNNFYFTKNLNNGCIFSFANTTYQTYTLPDASGTLALTSSLGAYLPLAGGTLTGALNGTSASFSSNSGIIVGSNSRAFIRQTVGGDAEIGAPANGTLALFSNGSSVLSFIGTGAATFSSSVTVQNGNTLILLQPGNSNGSVIRSVLNGDFRVTTGGTTDALTITNGGNVGIGTAIPSFTLHAKAASGSTTGLRLESSGGTTNFDILSSEGDGNAYLYQRSNFGILFGTNNTERMRITSGGQVLIGTATSNGWPLEIEAGSGGTHMYLKRSGAFARFYMGGLTSGATQFVIDAAGTGGVRLDAGATSWVSASDIRLKKIGKKIENAIESLGQMQTIYYSWKNSTIEKEHLGLIAQEVEKQFPEIVSESEIDGMKGVNYTELIPVLIAAVKELKQEIDTLKN